jgi:hypothetical protein
VEKVAVTSPNFLQRSPMTPLTSDLIDVLQIVRLRHLHELARTTDDQLG